MNKLQFIDSKAVGYARQQHGASLLEGIAYLGIAAIVILGAVSLLTTAFSGAESNRGSEEVLGLRTTIKKMYQGQYPTGVGTIANDMSSVKALPTTLVVDTTTNPVTITNTWGGAVTFTGGTGTFTIQYTQVPADACASIITGSSGWTSVKVGSGSALTPPISGTVAVGACSASSNTIIWTGN